MSAMASVPGGLAWLCHIIALCLSFPLFKTVIIILPIGVAVGLCRVAADMLAVRVCAGKQTGLKEMESVPVRGTPESSCWTKESWVVSGGWCVGYHPFKNECQAYTFHIPSSTSFR